MLFVYSVRKPEWTNCGFTGSYMLDYFLTRCSEFLKSSCDHESTIILNQKCLSDGWTAKETGRKRGWSLSISVTLQNQQSRCVGFELLPKPPFIFFFFTQMFTALFVCIIEHNTECFPGETISKCLLSLPYLNGSVSSLYITVFQCGCLEQL